MSRFADDTIIIPSDPQARVHELETQLEQTVADYNDLAQMGAILASILNLEEVLAALMDMALRMVGGQVGAIVLQTPQGLRPQISWGLDHRVLPLILRSGEPICERTIETQEGALLAPYSGPAIAMEGINLHIETVITEPIITKSETVGCIVIVNKNAGGGFTARDRTVLQTLVNYAAVAVQNARLLAESIEKRLMDHELVLAAQVQKTLVPHSKLTFGGATVESLYIPARKVGGDYFDILPNPETDSFLLAIGDVSSKGMPAALLMTAARSIVRAAAKRTGSVSEIVNEINRVVCEDLTGQKDMFITFFLASINTRTATISYTNAGHPPPFLWRSGEGDVAELGKGGVFLGQFPEFRYGESAERFKPSDRLLAYTDGVVEAADQAGILYGRDRLGRFLRQNASLSSGEILKMLREDLENGFRHADYIDDVTAVLVEFGKEDS
jgi:serine phosphatase RsbU (regulator of sigma subunit)